MEIQEMAEENASQKAKEELILTFREELLFSLYDLFSVTCIEVPPLVIREFPVHK